MCFGPAGLDDDDPDLSWAEPMKGLLPRLCPACDWQRGPPVKQKLLQPSTLQSWPMCLWTLLSVWGDPGLVTGDPRSDDNSDDEDLDIVVTDGDDVRGTMRAGLRSTWAQNVAGSLYSICPL